MAGYCALRAWRSWLIGIRFKGKSGHLERVEIIRSSEKFSASYWLYNWTIKRDSRDREIEGFI
jgi:hypothetical protein